MECGKLSHVRTSVGWSSRVCLSCRASTWLPSKQHAPSLPSASNVYDLFITKHYQNITKHYQNITRPLASSKKLLVMQVACTRGICNSLRLAIPPLTALHSFACSVASLGQCPCHHLPGHRSLRHVDPAGCCLGQDKPST